MSRFPKRLLVVEDNPDQALLIKTVLEHYAGRNGTVFEFATTVHEAAEKIATSRFDLILTDYRLPDQTGLDLLTEIKNRNLNIPTLLMTAMGDEMLAVNALKAGFSDYLVKEGNYSRQLPYAIEQAYERYLTEQSEKEAQQELVQKNIHLNTMNQKLAELSIRDELTGLYNHRFLQDKITEEFARAARYHHPLSCLMVDIDFFKAINDGHGHPVGDQVLKELGAFLVSHLRDADTVARYGGEEFVILLPHVGYEGAHTLAERLRKKIMDHLFVAPKYSIHVTISIGVSSFPDDTADRKDSLLIYSDKALYRAKGSGRNKVCLYRELNHEFDRQMPELKIENAKVAELRGRLFDISEMAKRAYIEATKALVNALEIKDPHTLGHAARVGHYSALVAREMGMKEDDVHIIEHGGLLHDVGKICIPDEILLKPGAFNHSEYERMKQHPLLGYQIVKSIKFLAEEALIILYHHEWLNGEGYPHHLKGREIPISARIVSVIDAYDTMRIAGGRYKKLLTCEEAVRELMSCAGTQFDPEVVVHLVHALIKKGELNLNAPSHDQLEALLAAKDASGFGRGKSRQ